MSLATQQGNENVLNPSCYVLSYEMAGALEEWIRMVITLQMCCGKSKFGTVKWYNLCLQIIVTNVLSPYFFNHIQLFDIEMFVEIL